MAGRMPISLWLLLVAAVPCAGCNEGPFQQAKAGSAAPFQPPPGGGAVSAVVSQAQSHVQELERRIAQLDSNNAELHRQLAQVEQARQAAQSQVSLLQQQLGEVASRLKELQVAKQQSDQQVQALQASTRLRGGATITANNSLRQSLGMVSLLGLEVRQEGEVIRIEVPSDKLFLPGTAQLQTDGYRILDEVAAAIQRTYPRQRVVIEAHTDDSLAANPTAAHLLTAAQAQAVFAQLVQRGRLPPRQLSVLAMGDNHPLASNATPAGKAKNRRIEIVIYPDALDG
jgi:chemotaxis protein MotB